MNEKISTNGKIATALHRFCIFKIADAFCLVDGTADAAYRKMLIFFFIIFCFSSSFYMHTVLVFYIIMIITIVVAYLVISYNMNMEMHA